MRNAMDSVFLLWHTHEIDGETKDKLIGVYANRSDAQAAIARLSDKPGFRDSVDGFEIASYVVGRDGWTEGYISARHAMSEN